MAPGGAVGIGENLTRAEHRAEDPAAHRHAPHVWGEGVTEKFGRLDLWQLPGRDDLWPAVDRERGRAGGPQIPSPVHVPEGGDHPTPTADGDHRDRRGSAHAPAATPNGEQDIATEAAPAPGHRAAAG